MAAPASAKEAKRTRVKFEALRAIPDAHAAVSSSAAVLGKSLFISNSGETNQCNPIQVVEICEGSCRTRKVYACAKRRCTGKACKTHALTERKRLLERLMVGKDGHPAIFPGTWGVIVLPYAKEARDPLRWTGLLSASRRGAAVLVQEWVLGNAGLSYLDGWRLGILSVDHPEGDKRPGEWKPHHNLIFPTVAFHPDGRRRELRYFVTKEQLDDLRQRWRWWQESVVLGAKLKTKANVFYEFRQKARAKKHCARYFPRTFPAWHSRTQRLSYFGAFSCRSIHGLAEVAQAKAEEKPCPQGFCGNCGAEVKFTLSVDANGVETHLAIPARFRAVTGGSSP